MDRARIPQGQPPAPGTALEPAYFFLHIPKTAGQSLRSLLEVYFAPQEVCRAAEWNELLALPREQLASFRYFRGHLAGDVPRFLGRPVRQFTFLRDPVERALSHYANSVRSPIAEFHRPVTRLGSFSACVRDPQLQRFLFSNVQAAYVGDLRLPGEPGHGFLTDVSEDELFARAKARLEAMDVVGITERFRDSVSALCHVFEWDLPQRSAHRNPNPAKALHVALGPEDRALLESINRVDRALFDAANARLDGVLGQIEEERMRRPEQWLARQARRVAALEALAERQAQVLEAWERERNSIGGRIGRRLQGVADRIVPPGSSLRMRLHNLMHPKRPRGRMR